PCPTSPLTSKTGTLVRISDLRSGWDEERLDDLSDQLSRLVSPFEEVGDFEIWLTLPGKDAKPTRVTPPEFIAHPPYSIRGEVDDTGRWMRITSTAAASAKRAFGGTSGRSWEWRMQRASRGLSPPAVPSLSRFERGTWTRNRSTGSPTRSE